jgi:hypothetical protein
MKDAANVVVGMVRNKRGMREAAGVGVMAASIEGLQRSYLGIEGLQRSYRGATVKVPRQLDDRQQTAATGPQRLNPTG